MVERILAPNSKIYILYFGVWCTPEQGPRDEGRGPYTSKLALDRIIALHKLFMCSYSKYRTAPNTLDSPRSSYQFIPPFLYDQRKNKVLNYSKCLSTPNDTQNQSILSLVVHHLKTKTISINRGMKTIDCPINHYYRHLTQIASAKHTLVTVISCRH